MGDRGCVGDSDRGPWVRPSGPGPPTDSVARAAARCRRPCAGCRCAMLRRMAGSARTPRRYGKRDDLIVHEDEPFNAETTRDALGEGPLTATDAFYVRGHGALPETGEADW